MIFSSNQPNKNMNWIKPEFEEISLSMEVTAYVNAGK
jgi:coenzyme PQQ precursor peptide PqqA